MTSVYLPHTSTVKRNSYPIASQVKQLSHCQLGRLGEALATRMLKLSGYRPLEAASGGTDIEAADVATGEIFRVEVKTSRQGRDGKWRSTLIKRGHTDARKSQWLLLICILESGLAIPYLMPVDATNGKPHIVITSNPLTYAGRYAAYRTLPGALELL